MTIQKLNQKLNEQKNKIGLVGGRVEVKEYDEMEHPISALISSNGWDIMVSVKKGFKPIDDKRQRAYARVKKIEDGLETLVMHVGGLHEPAHWELPIDSDKGCPYDTYWHDKILEAVKQALPEDKKQQAGFVTNAFEDIIINPRCREWNRDFSGQVLFFDWEGLNLKEKGMKNYTPVYEAFVKLNMHLWGDNIDKCLLKRHYSNDKKIDNIVKEIINDLKLQENIQDTAYLFNKQAWSEMARAFAKNLADLIEEQPPIERLSAFDCGDGSGGEQKPSVGNGIEQKTGTREGKEEIAFGRYASDDRLSTNITNYEQLDALYRKLARDIPVQVEAMTKEQGLKITPLNYRAFDPEVDDPVKIKSSKIVLNHEGVNFGVPNQPLTISHKSKIQRRSFPDFKMIVLDNSGSMAQAPDNSSNIGRTNSIPWGDNSKYHYALLGFYGVENFLQGQGIAQYIHHGLSLFSSQTRYKEADFHGLNEVRKYALSPEFGGTKLDAEVLTDALKGRESFVLSISDGEIENWGSEKKQVETLAKNNYFAHIQLGSRNGFTRDLESWGIPVFYVSSGKDLSKLMVNITKDAYEKFIHQ